MTAYLPVREYVHRPVLYAVRAAGYVEFFDAPDGERLFDMRTRDAEKYLRLALPEGVVTKIRFTSVVAKHK